MQHINRANFSLLENYIESYADRHGGRSPSMAEIAQDLGMSKSTVSKYINIMKAEGRISFDGHRSVRTGKMRSAAEGLCSVPLLGEIACGLPVLAEENIEEYVSLPVSIFGRGEYFLLRARGDSMINAGICEGDLVLARQQETAGYDQIVVALVGEEATLKRFRPENGRICLHAENPAYEDIFPDSCIIQGVAVKVIRDIL